MDEKQSISASGGMVMRRVPVWSTGTRDELLSHLEAFMPSGPNSGVHIGLNGVRAITWPYLEIDCPACGERTSYERDEVPGETTPCPQCGAEQIVYEPPQTKAPDPPPPPARRYGRAGELLPYRLASPRGYVMKGA